MRDNTMTRTRWAAVGAVVTITMGVGGLNIARATVSDGPRPAFVAITPCRLADTRPPLDNRGTRATPLGPEETFTLTAPGDHGDCHNTIPPTASGVSLNVTAIDQTAATFLTIYPTGAAQPLTSNLNPFPGQPPVPNAVTVGINAGGQFSIFNKAGSVNVIVDVVGYYEDHDHDDRYYTETETDAAVAAAIATPNHVTGAQVADGSLGLSDLTGSGTFLSYNLGTVVAVPASDCVVESVDLGTGNAFRMLIPMRVGVGLPGSANLSAAPVVLNTSGAATIQICNRSASPFASAAITLDYYLS